jgi:class 3 adenylate cyclase
VDLSERHYRWTWDYASSPDALWPRVADTDRSNRDCGFPPFEVRPPREEEAPAEPGVRRLRSTYLGIAGEWEEREFEWVRPARFLVDRRFTRGPISRMVQSCELSALPGGGTRMVYEMRVTPTSLLGAALVALAIGVRMRRRLERVFREYDREAGNRVPAPRRSRAPFAGSGMAQRLNQIAARLVADARQPEALVRRLCGYIEAADDMSLAKMRPYAIADAWGADRVATLDLFLHATREGMLDFSWEVLCPHCRGSRGGKGDLSGVSSEEHCDSCGIDFTVNFDQSVELNFVPHPAIRKVTRVEYCLGGPQITPHVVAQKSLGPRESLFVAMSFPEGRYRIRTRGVAVMQAFRIERGGAPAVRIDVGPAPVPVDEPVVAPDGILNAQNTDSSAHMAFIERVAWSDQSVTAAAVTSRQVFRDLFSREILRPGERISVGTITIVFTDLKNSTQLYRDIGDAPAFGRVLGHFDVIKAAVAAEGGAIVKTMGDAVMAAFVHPDAALRAMARAQAELSSPERARSLFALKCSIHQGPCLAINQNDRLDYFGTTVNVGSRLCSLSTGSDIVISEQVLGDPGVSEIINSSDSSFNAIRDASTLKGIAGAPFAFWRISGRSF